MQISNTTASEMSYVMPLPPIVPLSIPVVLTGNAKRKESCKNVGGSKKRGGHIIEKEFTKQYNWKEIDNPIEYGAKSDTTIDSSHQVCEHLKEKLNIQGLNVSNKSGQNIQFTLGKIPELENVEIEELTKPKVNEIFNKYLKKIHSDAPADILVYKDTDRWIFFNMDDIVEYISEKCIWRKIEETGRIKGDFNDGSRKGYSQYITYEYRSTHKSYFLGLNGGKGKKFIDLLIDEKYGIKHYFDKFDYE